MSVNADTINQCLLRSRNYKYRDVQLPHQVPVIVGRGPQTKIRERKCSKQQVEIVADYNLKKAVIKQLGQNPSEIDSKLVNINEEVKILEGADVNLIKDDLKYTLEFVTHNSQENSRHRRHHRTVYGSARASKESFVADSGLESSLSAQKAKRNLDQEGASCKKVKQDEDDLSEDEMRRQDIVSKLKAMQASLSDDLDSAMKADRWDEYDHSKLLMFTPIGLTPSSKVAAFDLDHTIISTKSGRVFPTSMDDWQIMYPEIPQKLKKMSSDGYKILIFTNQKGISRGKTSAPEFKNKIQRIVKRLGIPIQVMVSTGLGKYRKPNTGMWDYFLQKGNQGIQVDIPSCMYVGDAAGRPDNWAPKKKKDFSCADRLFALNVGMAFFTPEEFFLNQKPGNFKMPAFDPRSVGSSPLAVKCEPLPVEERDANNLVSTSPELVIFVGFPASGKSHFAMTYLIPNGYVHVNRDILGTWQKCVSECSKAIQNGIRVVIDNTNPDAESRSRYIDYAKQYQVPCRCFLFTCSIEQARHNNLFRQLHSPNDKNMGVTEMVLNSYKSKYQEPTLKEGFTEILKINFVPKFKTRQEENAFRKFLIEK